MSSYSYTTAATTTFTLTHAKHLAAKVATDMKRVQRFYERPSDSIIEGYEKEIIEFLKAGFLESVTYGFQRDGEWIEPTLRYTSQDLATSSSADDDPGKIRPGADVSNAVFTSFLIYNAAWYQQTLLQQEAFKKNLPFQRSTGNEPCINGYLANDRIYSSGGRALNRATVRSY